MARHPELLTIGDRIAWSYANLACAHSALKAQRTKHATVDWVVRAKLFKGLRDGTMKIGSLFEDERLQLTNHPSCTYCGDAGALSVDHLIAQAVGGGHDQHNLVRACRGCNSSKGKQDLLLWYERQGGFPPILLLRRYLKIVASHCVRHGVWDYPVEMIATLHLPFDLERLPMIYPPLSDLRL